MPSVIDPRRVASRDTDTEGVRQKPQAAFNGGTALFQHDPHFSDLLLLYEYFNADDGTGLGTSHQTGWTGLTAKLIQQVSKYEGTGRRSSGAMKRLPPQGRSPAYDA